MHVIQSSRPEDPVNGPGLHMGLRVTAGFDLYWLGEATSGVLTGRFDQRLPALLTADLDLRVQAPSQGSLQPQPDGRVRLRLWRAGEALPAILARAARPSPEQQEALVESLASAHPEAPDEQDGDIIQSLAAGLVEKYPAALEKKASLAVASAWLDSGSPLPFLDVCLPSGGESGPLAEAVLSGQAALPGHAVEWFPCTLASLAETHLELHLPFLDRKDWKSPWSQLAAATVEVSEDGALLVSTPAEHPAWPAHQCASLLASAVTSAQLRVCPRHGIRFDDTRRLDAALAAILVEPLLANYGLSPAVGDWLRNRDGDVEITFSLAIPGPAAVAWLDAPAKRISHLAPQFSQVSIAVQQALRAWLPFLTLSHPDVFLEPDGVHALLAFAAMRPFYGETCGDFTYDPLNRDRVAKALHTSSARFVRELRKVCRWLWRRDRKLSRKYSPRRAPAILQYMARIPQSLAAPLAAETFFMEEFCKLASAAFLLRSGLRRTPPLPPARLRLLGDKFAYKLLLRLRRLDRSGSLQHFSTMVVMEATAALARAQGKPCRLRAAVRLRQPGAPDEFIAVN